MVGNWKDQIGEKMEGGGGIQAVTSCLSGINLNMQKCYSASSGVYFKHGSNNLYICWSEDLERNSRRCDEDYQLPRS